MGRRSLRHLGELSSSSSLLTPKRPADCWLLCQTLTHRGKYQTNTNANIPTQRCGRAQARRPIPFHWFLLYESNPYTRNFGGHMLDAHICPRFSKKYPKVVTSFLLLLWVARNSQNLEKVLKSCQKLPRGTKSFQKL